MKKLFFLILPVLAAAGLALLFWPRLQPQAPAILSGLQVTPSPGFKRALAPVQFSFPLDYGPHPDFQTEWWYYTGNLQAADGSHYGFELTFFRRALQPPGVQPTQPSDWATVQVYMAHFALTDVPDNRFYYEERFSRGAAGLAGATGLPSYKVWLNDWQVAQTSLDTYHLTAATGDFAIDLDLKDLKGPVLQGDRGLSQKGPAPGDASYYFSQTRLETSGSIRLGQATLAVTGLSWMDHEYSTSALSAGQVGWNWFALQLNDGSELTVYTIRRSDTSIDPYSRGLVVRPDGSTVSLKEGDFTIKNDSIWKSPASGAVYPSHWTLSVPSEHLVLDITPYIPDQELHVSFTYWEGAVKIEGEYNGKQVAGNGYVELTGYAQSLAGQF
jgi:predicted secreted hydrolase